MAKGDAMGKHVDSLYLTLGLNASDLELGFKTAGQTVKQAISRLNSDANRIRLKADIDVTRLEAAGKSVEALRTRERALNEELTVQQRKLELLNRAYEANAKTYGKDSGLTRGVDMKRLYQTRDIERLRAQIAAVNQELAKTATKSGSAFSRIGAEAGKAKAKIEGLTGSIKGINSAIAGATGALAGGYGLFSITDSAMQAGENLYKLSTRLHTTTAEAGKLQKIFQLSGTDINQVIPALVRIQKQALAASKSENEMTAAMREFGFSLTDNNGNLLSHIQTLEQLAKGYNKAVQTGKEAEFVTNVLGSRSAGLVSDLQNFATNMEIVSRIQSTGLLNPKEAHELYVEWQAMQMQAKQLTGVIGQSLMPIAGELMPEITEGFKEVAKLIADNKDAIKDFGSAAGDVLGTLSKTVVGLISVLGELKGQWNDITGLSKDEAIIRANGGGRGLDIASGIGGILGAIGGARLGGTKGAMMGGLLGSQLTGDAGIFFAKMGAKAGMWGGDWNLYEANAKRKELQEQEKKAFAEFEKSMKKRSANVDNGFETKNYQKSIEVQKQWERELATATSTRQREQLQAIREKVNESIKAGEDEAKAWIKAEKDISKAVKDALKEAKAANEELEKSIYSLTHSDFQTSLHDVDLSAKSAIERGANPVLAAREAELKKAEIIRKFNDETAAYLDGIFEDSLTQRLNQIERERRAWIKKGLDEVAATRAAEAQKKQALNDSVKNMFTSQKKYLDVYRNAMGGQIGDGLWDFSQSNEQRQQSAVRAIQRQMMKDAGVDPNWSTNMSEVQGFLKAMKGAENWGLGMIRGGIGDLGSDSMKSIYNESNAEITSILGQINTGVPEINSNLSQILGAIQENGNKTPEVNVNPSINVDLGGAYVFDDQMKRELTEDITNKVASSVSQAVTSALSRTNFSYGG